MMREKEKHSLNPCPCCGHLTLHELGAYEICEVCGWEDDPVQSADPAYAGGANSSSLNEAQVRWKARSV
ncbi:CPCC family cysteine-rich protein [Paraburkholderia caledonica]|jgi:hypothetical protein|uniref:CPCC family cysteine-rich protein n=2 Tax=Paraburkholderia caledonica TaxID=134536 RepID=UPI0009FE7006